MTWTHRPRRRRAGDVWDQRVAAGLAFLRRRLTGDYDVDEFGFDPELTDALFHPLLRLLYRDWFRTEVSGVEHLPRDGAGLVVANHSGTIALDAMMLAVACTTRRRPAGTCGCSAPTWSSGCRCCPRSPASPAAPSPATPTPSGCCARGELVGVFPEGFKGVGKPYRDRYKLQRFGRGGFVSAALRTGTPIVPVAIVGAEEIYPLIGDIKPLARLLGPPYFPVTPTFPWLGPLGAGAAARASG